MHHKLPISSFLLSLFLTVGFAGSGSAQEVRSLAVIAESGAENATAILEATLSTRKSIQLVERGQLSDITSERILGQLSGGQSGSLEFVKADGVVLLGVQNRKQGKPLGINVRIIDVSTGAVAWYMELTKENPAELSEDAVERLSQGITRIASRLGKLDETIAVSISQIRMADGAAEFEDARHAREFQTLLARRLQLESDSFLVLERDRLDKTTFAHRFLGNASSNLWTSGIIIEGTFRSGPGDKIRVNLNLLKAGQASPVNDIVVDPEAMAPAIEVAMNAVRKEASIRLPEDRKWNVKEEAKRFGEEARWALSAGLYSEAEDLAMAAGALDNELRSDAGLNDILYSIRYQRCAGLKYRFTYTSDFTGLLEAAIALVEAVNADDSISFARQENVLRVITKVLYFGYRNRYHLVADNKRGFSALRSGARSLFARGQSKFIQADLTKSRAEADYRNWRKTVSRAGGLWFDDPEAAWNHWNDLTTSTLEIVALPNRGTPQFSYDTYSVFEYLVPPGIDWSKRFDLPTCLSDWVEFEKRIKGLDPVLLELYQYTINNALREWYIETGKSNSYLKSNDTIRGFLEEQQILRDNMGIHDLVLRHREALLSRKHVDFYLPALFRDSVLSLKPKEEWLSQEAREFVGEFATAKLKSSDHIVPTIYDFFCTSYWEKIESIEHYFARRNNLENEELAVLADAFYEHADRMRESHPSLPHDFFYWEEKGLAEKGHVPKRQPVKINPDTVLVLDKTVHTGFPVEIASRSYEVLFFDLTVGNKAHFSIMEYERSGNTRQPKLIHLHTVDFLTGKKDTVSIPVSPELFAVTRFGRAHQKRLNVAGHHWVHYFGFETGGGQKAGLEKSEFILHANRKTKQVECLQVSSSSNWFVVNNHCPGNPKMYFLLLNKPDENRLNEIVNSGGHHRLLSYELATRKLVTVFDTLRRPDRNFLDDRNYFTARYFADDIAGRPLFSASFTIPGTKKEIYNNFAWNDDTKQWESPDFVSKYGYSRGMNYLGRYYALNGTGGYREWVDGKWQNLEGKHEWDALYRTPPAEYLRHPIASEKSPLGTIRQSLPLVSFGKVTGPGITYSQLFTRVTENDQETIVLRVAHKDFGPYHYDLILDLRNHPKLSRNSYTEDYAGGPDYRYGWRLGSWDEGLSIWHSTFEQIDYYRITEDEIVEKLKVLKGKRNKLTEFETLLDQDAEQYDKIESGPEVKRSQLDKAIIAGDIKRLAGYLRHAIPKDLRFGVRDLEMVHYAALHGEMEVVQLLEEHGYDLTVLSGNEKRPPLAFAIESGNLELVKSLIKKAGAVDQVSEYNPPLFWQALATGNLDIVKAVGGTDLDSLLQGALEKTRASGMMGAYRTAKKLQADGSK